MTYFGDDWCGVFLRGDDAFANGCAIRAALHNINQGKLPDEVCIMQLEVLAELLASCNEALMDDPHVINDG